jgi:ribosomal protein S13
MAWDRAAMAAEPTVELTVSRHPSVEKIDADKIKKILHDASEVMKKAGCPVTFTLKSDDIGELKQSVPTKIVTEHDLEVVHSQPGDIKIVKEIHCCAGRRERPNGRIEGCSWPPNPPSHSIILTEDGVMLGNRWAHEFGHRMGLPHREKVKETDKTPLMTGDGVDKDAFQISDHECDCIQHPGKCKLSETPPPLKPNEMACATTH